MIRFVALLPLFAQAAFGLYSANDGVILSTPATFQADVMSTKQPVLVEFFAPW